MDYYQGKCLWRIVCLVISFIPQMSPNAFLPYEDTENAESVFKTTPQNVVSRIGDRVKISCGLANTDDVPSVFFNKMNSEGLLYIYGDETKEHSHGIVFEHKLGQVVLVIDNVSSTHAGSYFFQDTESGKIFKTDLIVIPHDTPSCTPRDSSQKFFCKFSFFGNLNATLAWYDSQGNELAQMEIVAKLDAELELPKHTYSQVYTCRAVFNREIYSDDIERQSWTKNSSYFSNNSCTTQTPVEQKQNVNEDSNDASSIIIPVAISCTIGTINLFLNILIAVILKRYIDQIKKKSVSDVDENPNDNMEETSNESISNPHTIQNVHNDLGFIKDTVRGHEQDIKKLLKMEEQIRQLTEIVQNLHQKCLCKEEVSLPTCDEETMETNPSKLNPIDENFETEETDSLLDCLDVN